MSEVEPIVVVLAADSVFAKQLAVVIAGISKFARREHHLFVLHDGYEPALMRQVTTAAGSSVHVDWLDARSTTLDDAYLPPTMATASLFRLLMGALLPEHVERVIYIDADVAVRQTLDELWEMNIEGCALGAVRDSAVPWAAAPDGLPWAELKMAPTVPYFNAGILVIDMKRWRSQRIGEGALAALSQHRFLYGDQCALNAVLDGHWAAIDPRWNLQAGLLADKGSLAWVAESPRLLAEAMSDPAIVHFNHSAMRKPWQQSCTHPYRELWLEHLDLTEWAGWRPPANARGSPARAVLRRVRKAGGVLLRG